MAVSVEGRKFEADVSTPCDLKEKDTRLLVSNGHPGGKEGVTTEEAKRKEKACSAMKRCGLKKSERITRKDEFDELIQKGRKLVKDAFLVHFLRKKRESSRVGFLVGKRIGGAAVRNRTKRLLKEIYRLNKDAIGREFDLLIRARRTVRYLSFRDIERSLLEVGEELHPIREHKEQNRG